MPRQRTSRPAYREGDSNPAPRPRAAAPAPFEPDFAPGTMGSSDAPAKRPRAKKIPQKVPEHGMQDVLGIVMLAISILYFLSLFSYDPRDLPTWAPFNPTDTSNLTPANLVGTTGAIVAGYSFMLMGLAAYLLPFCLTWFGVCKVTSRVPVPARGWLGVVLLIVCGAAFIHVSGIIAARPEICPLGPGGAIGRMLGGRIAFNLLGQAGSVFLLGVIYLLGLIFVTGMQPVQVINSLREDLPPLIASAWAWLRQTLTAPRMQPAYADSPMPFCMPEEPKKKARAGKSPTPSSIGCSTATEPPVAEMLEQLPLDLGQPTPQIIDSSAPRQTAKDDTRPSLSEVWEKKRAAKIEQTGPAPLGSLTERFKDYKLPSLDLLGWPDPALIEPVDPKELQAMQDTIVRTLADFKISVTPGDITRGPAITRYEVRPVDGLRVSRIAQLDADLARATKAERINILAPIPGKDTVGIEIANKNKVLVPIRELLEDEAFQNGKAKLPVALGKDVYGKTIIADLAAMPHCLVAGATGSGKSVCVNSIITSLICRFAPDELRFIMIDPKVVEMQTYANLPHLALPVVTDPKKALLALRWVVKEMEARYQLFAQESCRNFETFNNRNRKKTSLARAAAVAAESGTGLQPESVDAPTTEQSGTGVQPVSGDATTAVPPAPPSPKIIRPRAAAPVAIGAQAQAAANAKKAANAARHPGTPTRMHMLSAEASDDMPPWEEDFPDSQILKDQDEASAEFEDVTQSDDSDFGTSDLTDANNDWTGDSIAPPRDSVEDDDMPLVPSDFPTDRAHRSQAPVIPDTMPYIVVIIDELADLMQTAPADIEVAIARITQMARAAGFHLIVATQTPRADVITGVIKANVPSRIAFQVASALDSRVILDRKGAEKLVGKGDMLYLPPGTGNLVRSQGAYVTDDEIQALVDHCVTQGGQVFDSKMGEGFDSEGEGDEFGDEDDDAPNREDLKILEKCLEVIRQEKKASTSLLQRRLGLGYGKAARMMDILEDRGIIGPGEGAKPREILVQMD